MVIRIEHRFDVLFRSALGAPAAAPRPPQTGRHGGPDAAPTTYSGDLRGIPALRSLAISATGLFVLAGCGSVELSGNVNTGDEFENAKLERVILENKTGYRIHVAVMQTDSKRNIDFEVVDDVEPNGAGREDAAAPEA